MVPIATFPELFSQLTSVTAIYYHQTTHNGLHQGSATGFVEGKPFQLIAFVAGVGPKTSLFVSSNFLCSFFLQGALNMFSI